MLKFILIKSPDEWATTKQACRDELVVYLFFLPYILRSTSMYEALFYENQVSHFISFRNERYKHATELSKYIWSLKDRNIAHDIKLRKVNQARSYSNVTKRYNLCLWEKIFILGRPEMSTLNRRNELVSGSIHAWKFLLKNVFT